MLGGRVAEEIVFNEITTGAENDIERATNVARKMVTEYGMSDRIGPIAMGHKEELIFLGREIGEQKNYSEKSAEAIDEEIKRIINTGYELARDKLTNYRNMLDALADRLIQEETLEGGGIGELFPRSRANLGAGPRSIDA